MIDHDDSRGDYLEPVLDALLRIERKVDALVVRTETKLWLPASENMLRSDPAGVLHKDGSHLRPDDDSTRTPQEQG